MAYDKIIFEYLEYCEHARGSWPDPASRYVVSHDNIAEFVVYQAFREKRKRDKAYELKLRDSGNEKFDKEDFDRVMNSIDSAIHANQPLREPDNGCAVSHIAQVRAAMRRLHKTQVNEQTNSIPWEQVWQNDLEDLARMVASRKTRQDKKNYVEKVDDVSTAYEVVSHLQPIENWFFLRGNMACQRTTFAGLRNRYFYLRTLQSLLRGESLMKEDLSDQFLVKFQGKRDPHEMEILMSQVATGKTNRAGKKIFGRSCRHKDVRMCAFGALAFYYLYWFQCTCEMDRPPDFTDAKAWFDIKVRRRLVGMCP